MRAQAYAVIISPNESVLEKCPRQEISSTADLDVKGISTKGNGPVTRRPSVSFHPEVDVREFSVGIVENPMVSCGVPIGLTGECRREYSCSIHDSNHIHVPTINLFIPAKEREMILIRQGTSWREIHREVQKTNTAINQRRRKKSKNTTWLFHSKTWNQMLRSGLNSLGRIFFSIQRKLVRVDPGKIRIRATRQTRYPTTVY